MGTSCTKVIKDFPAKNSVTHFVLLLERENCCHKFHFNCFFAVPTASILGGPDIYVDKGSMINLTCTVKYSSEV